MADTLRKYHLKVEPESWLPIVSDFWMLQVFLQLLTPHDLPAKNSFQRASRVCQVYILWLNWYRNYCEQLDTKWELVPAASLLLSSGGLEDNTWLLGRHLKWFSVFGTRRSLKTWLLKIAVKYQCLPALLGFTLMFLYGHCWNVFLKLCYITILF